MQQFSFVIIFVSITLCACLIGATLSAKKNNNQPTTVDSVDLSRYVGMWYEIAKIPNRFQDNCAYGTTAEYLLCEDGKIEVINRCYDENGKLDKATGIAKVVDKASNAKLKVSFVSILGWRLFWGDYWIIGLDPDYRWAIVGTPDRKYGWILSRSKLLSEDVLNTIFDILREHDYQPADFQFTEHRE
ncbi:hypothetical protein GF337_04055 [candidate division KSB1 bacterium]|nr:hypothetical protein [candidate division KSB1 bacterium]